MLNFVYIRWVIKLTKNELKQIYNINREIKMWQKELNKLKGQSLVRSPIISDMPKGGKKFDMSDYISAITDYETVIRGLLAELQIQRKKIIEYIESIDDSLMRQIIFYRNVSCMTWWEVADAIGGNNTENSVKKAYSRFFMNN